MAYCSTAQVKAYLGNSTSVDDALLDAIIPRAQAGLDRYCHRTFEAASDTTRTFDADHDTDGPFLYLDEDLASITSITNGDGTTITSTQYTTEPRNRTPYCQIKLLTSSGLVWEYDSNNDPENAISVTGRWAWSVTADADIEHLCIRYVGWIYKQKDSQVYDVTATPELGVITVPQGIPKDLRIAMDTYKRRS